MTERRDSRRVFSIAPGVSFLDTLARAVLDGAFAVNGAAGGGPIMAADPLAIGDTTIFLPTRRACRQLGEAFLKASPADALVLPTIRPIGEANEDLALIESVTRRDDGLPDAELPDAIGELERRLVLATLVMRWSETLRGEAAAAGASRATMEPAAGARTPAQAMHLARELARLIDMVENENASLSGLGDLVPDALSEHWQQTLAFLEIITAWWPAHLDAAGQLAPADRRNRLIIREAERLRRRAAKGPIIVAGVTGSIPASAELIRAVLERDEGAVVLPGLDRQMGQTAWARLRRENPEHPQHALATLLERLDVARDDVRALAGGEADPQLAVREAIIGEAMRPAGSTDHWYRLGERFDGDGVRAAFDQVHRLTVPTAQDEAEAVALIMREAAETPGRTAALVSPDRLLARRVAVRLESWGIRVDDSAGRPFPKTVPGAFLDLTIEAFHQNFAPGALMALIKHPLTRLGRPVVAIRRMARALEVGAFRAPYIGDGIDGIRAQIDQQQSALAGEERRDRAGRRLRPEDWAGALALVDDIAAAFAPLLALEAAGGTHDLADLAEAHMRTAEALATLPAAEPETDDAQASGDDATVRAASELWRDDAGHAGAQLFAQLLDRSMPAPAMASDAYPDFYRALVAGEAVRSLVPVHPRLAIWGPFEARLQRPDIVILGSLNEGTWPEAADPGPWLNRPMRAKLGLPLPEERIGHAAHDVAQLFGAEKVYVTRAEKVDGNPTVPSRWLMRLDAVLAATGAGDALAADKPWVAWARARDVGARLDAARQPEPRPPFKLRPRRLSVSSIETWIANPYAIFAQRILKLDALPRLGQAPGADLRGTIVHAALGQFAMRYPEELPDDPADELLAIARDVFQAYRSQPRIEAFWLRRFERFAQWFGETEAHRRVAGGKVLGEVDGKLVFAAGRENFTLTARADRIDAGPDGLWITDYKTGASLGRLASRAKSKEAPQLPLEAAIAGAGGFAGVGELPVKGLRYISASGGEPPGAEQDIKVDDIGKLAKGAIEDLARLVARYDDETTPYRAMRRAGFTYDYDAYAQLARVGEWASADSEGES